MSTQQVTLKKAMLQALEKSLGIVTTACRSVGIARKTHYLWCNNDKKYKEDVDSIGDVALDFAESHLHKQIGQDNATSTIFYLKTRGKNRGYIEKTEQDIKVITEQPLFPDVQKDNSNK